jgi:response regulator RpfG family c-di-GMP phosphodiesterase
VDDEPRVLEGLALHLGRLFRLSTATSGALGLEVLDQQEPYAVVIADMRMPEMDGAAFLAIVRQRFPDTVRLLLTGYAEVEAAIAAINEGQIFRFLTKPCPPSQLLEAVRAAVELNRLVTSERVLLEQTLHGSIKALTDILALTHPLAFGRAMRIRQFVSELAERTGLEERWQLEIAAMVSQIGCVTLPAEIMEKVHYGHSLSDEEQKQVSSLPFLAERLLGHIPRLEAVRAILAGSGERRYPSSPSQTADLDLVEKSAQMLRIATEYDTLESRGLSVDEALDSMRAQGGRYNGTLLQRFAELRGSAARTHEIREVPLHSVRVGMVLIEDLYLEGGILVAARGYEVTPGFVERSHNWHAQARKTVRVAMPR